MGFDDNIKPGTILVLNVQMPSDDNYNNKIFVIVCDEPLLLIKVNTSKQQTDIGKRFKEFQFKLKTSVYSLTYDSYLDCGTVWYGLLTRYELIKQIKTTLIIGELIKDHKNEVVRLTNLSRSISPYHKRLIKQKLS
jgi:hypothetical protein